jgi:hypothetical protein
MDLSAFHGLKSLYIYFFGKYLTFFTGQVQNLYNIRLHTI